MNPHVFYQGKEMVFKGAFSVFPHYKCGILSSLTINNGLKTSAELKEQFRELLPMIDSFGFKRLHDGDSFSADNLPFPKNYTAETSDGIVWRSADEQRIFKILLGVPYGPEYYKEKKYLYKFMYYNEVDFEYSKIGYLDCSRPIVRG